MSGSSSSSDTSHIWQAFYTNVTIAVIKIAAAVFTGSGAMLAEAIHSSSDCANQILLFFGIRGASKAASPSHPLGYGRSIYFWSFMVAMLLFTGGGVFSIYEGIHKIMTPEPVNNIGWALGILAVSLVLEGNATRGNIVEMNKRRGKVPFFRYLRETKDSDLIVVFGENAAASGGLLAALATLLLAWVTGDSRWDAVGSLIVGVILVMVAVFLAVEVKSLLIGERADPALEHDVRTLVEQHPGFEKLFNLITIQQGPGEVMLAMKVKVRDELTALQTCTTIDDFERALRARRPEIRWCFVEPDIAD
jgi:cation diffusion facilitator family transporter